MILSKRLNKLVQIYMEKTGEIVADIGTDHGYIPIYLTENKLCSKAYACDISKLSIDKAKNNIVKNSLENSIEVLQGDGLKPIDSLNCTMAFIAGMGGNLIVDILKKNKDIFKQLEYIIAMPAQNPEVLRTYLYKNGHKIIKEELVFDEKYYEIFMFEYYGEKKQINKLQSEFSFKYIVHPDGKRYFNHLRNYYIKVLSKLNYNINNNTKIKIIEVESKIKYLDELISLC